ncbi:MAG TPA: sugar nucleotide-binding protein [bacterium]|nr:sugar nucleotide-binding protein [bacterium]
MIRVAITGATGLVGSRIVELLGDRFEFLPLGHDMLDITNKRQVDQVIGATEFEYLLHLAAYTDVEGAETHQDRAYEINVRGTDHIYRAVTRRDRKLIYFSTDFVFDGTAPPYDEDSIPNPLGCYGRSKYEGEQIVHGTAMIVRISYPYRAAFPKKKDFVRRIRALLEQGSELQLVTDSIITPTFIDDIAYATEQVIRHFSPGIVHITGAQSLSPYAAGKLIATKFDFDGARITPITFEKFSALRAPRPRYSMMMSKLNIFYKMRTFEDGLKGFL